MKFYVDYNTKKVVSEKETTFFQSANLTNKISFYVTGIPSTTNYYLSMEFLLPNGRKTTIMTRDSFADGEANTLVQDEITYDIHNFSLTETILSVPGMLGFTCYINFTTTETVEGNQVTYVTSRGVLVNGVNMVVKTVGYSTDTMLVLGSGSEAGQIVTDIRNAISQLNSLLASKAEKPGTSGQPFQASVFTEGGSTLASKYHPKGGANNLDFVVQALTASEIKSNTLGDAYGNVKIGFYSSIYAYADLLPLVKNEYKLGNSDKYFKEAYVNKVVTNELSMTNGEAFIDELTTTYAKTTTLYTDTIYSKTNSEKLVEYITSGNTTYFRLAKTIIPTTNDITIGTNGRRFNYGWFTNVNSTNGYFTTLQKGGKDVATEEFVNDAVTRDALVSTIGNVSTAIDGLMSHQDKSNLDTLMALLGSSGGDADDVVNTIREVLFVFNQYPEGTSLVNALALKANVADVYNKTDVDTKLGFKANSADVYNQGQVDNLLGNKADASSVYTKEEVDAMFIGDTASLFAELEGVWA